ncbi:MAG: sensor histidine kinase [Candidatus Velthaea sp.]
MAEWQERAIDGGIAGGLVLSLGFAMRPQAHPLVRSTAAALSVLASVRMLTGRRSAPPREPAVLMPEPGENGKLVSIVAHEIRAPLAAILGAASLLDQYDGQIERPRRRELLRVALDATHQLAHLIDDLLLASRISGGHLSVERFEMDMVALVRDAIEAELTHSITVAAQEVLPNVYGDPVRTRQVVTNLLTNARAYATDKSIVIVSIVADADAVRTTIFNEGRGIAPEEQSKLFLPFANLSERRVDSTGLGLYIAKELVEAMGGTIGFDTQPGRNAVFWFTLPAAPASLHATMRV